MIVISLHTFRKECSINFASILINSVSSLAIAIATNKLTVIVLEDRLKNLDSIVFYGAIYFNDLFNDKLTYNFF